MTSLLTSKKPVFFVRGRHGGNILQDDQLFEYEKKKNLVDGRQVWRCIEYRQKKCPAYVHVVDHGLSYISYGAHVHDTSRNVARAIEQSEIMD